MNARTRRALRRRAALDAELAPFLRLATTRGAVTPDASAILRAMRTLGTGTMRPRVRAALRSRVVEALADTMRGMRLAPGDFGVSSYAGLADTFVTMLERVGYHEYGVTELRTKRAGLHGAFAGELFELLVIHHHGIQADLLGLADLQLKELTGLSAAAAKARLVDALGAAVDLRGTWGRARLVTDITVIRGNRRLKFTDFGYVSVLAPAAGGPSAVSFLVEGEVKLPRAAASFAEQIGEKQARFTDADRIEVRFADDGSPASFAPHEIVFDTKAALGRVALTTTSAPGQTWRLRTTKVGGFEDAYWRVGLTVDVEELRRLVTVLFRAAR